MESSSEVITTYTALNLVRDLEIEEMNQLYENLISVRDNFVQLEQKERKSIIGQILNFQMEDGSFSFLNDYKVPADIRVYYVYRPSYVCTQILMINGDNSEAIGKALDFCAKRNLCGHGYDGLPCQIEDTMNFINHNLTNHINESESFKRVIKQIFLNYSEAIYNGRCNLAFGGNVATAMMRVCQALINSGIVNENLISKDKIQMPKIPVFVYGTLLNGLYNHSLLESSHVTFAGTATLHGFKLFDLGSYPGIIECENNRSGNGACNCNVLGELYYCDLTTLLKLHMLEGEGNLYSFSSGVVSHKGKQLSVYTYVYNRNVNEEKEIASYMQPYSKFLELKDDYIWYVSYGSNLLEERFLHYIKGGVCRHNGKSYPACVDASKPLTSEPITLPYSVYFGNQSGTWNNTGVAFLDVSKPGFSYGRAYLITKQQFEHVRKAEGSSVHWYCNEIKLGEKFGIPVVTITNNIKRDANSPCTTYLQVIKEGIMETFSELPEEEVDLYIASLL